MTDIISKKYGIIVFMDALGTKRMMEHEESKTYLETWEGLNFDLDLPRN